MAAGGPDGSRNSDGYKSCRQANSYRKSIGFPIGLRRVFSLYIYYVYYIYIYIYNIIYICDSGSTTDHINKAPNVITEAANLVFCARQVDNFRNYVEIVAE